MDALCPVPSRFATLLAGFLGAIVGVPLAVLMAVAFYLGMAAALIWTIGRVLHSPLED